jgi:hypothetical protein
MTAGSDHDRQDQVWLCSQLMPSPCVGNGL